ncbi:hypothetical protein PQJ75_09205 [Rhodoplanes sp. TEM]|uniref:Histidine kinase n=1 Tax=Rhodoplanes tepidamans TaxID=200616 RepID=A0ABT5JDZ7_RHOTP|nr:MULTISPECIES: hypothetical protein [Rhodoplanes]MDC7787504.1 hypothetical protein [Rhodoplanes tepidamans]MDC7983905.1 hypothetical protein [Rhodoplanes sp. TEM]MDQ0354344.1 hypothetical protein [Rhodoplanes tepidamans]
MKTTEPSKDTSASGLQSPGSPDDLLPTAADCLKTIALAEAEKASEAMRLKAHEEAEQAALLDKFQKPSGVDDAERLTRAAAIVKRAVANGLTEVQVIRFPNRLCTDRGRAINNQEPGWETTLTGLPKELFEFWEAHMKPRGYRLKVQVVEFPGGIPGDIGMSLCWG